MEYNEVGAVFDDLRSDYCSGLRGVQIPAIFMVDRTRSFH